MAKDDADSTKLSDETIGYLEEVKKGKARKFAMICKGTSVISLVVYKKGNVEKRKKEAKEQGKGQFYFGVIDGKGIDIRFVLARADGFESAPVKSSVLKGFLEEAADLKFKPYFEIVDSAPLMLDNDDPLVARFQLLQSSALQACERFPDRAAEINALCLKIGQALDQEMTDEATTDIEALEKLLGSLGGTTESPVDTTSPTSSSGDANARIAKLTAALEKLQPLIEKVLVVQPNLKAELTAAYASAQRDLQDQSLDQAQVTILGLGKKLKEILAEKSTATETTQTASVISPELQEFNRRQQQLEPRLLNAQKASPEKSLAIGNVWQYALDQASAGNVAVANKAFDKLEQAIQAILNDNQDKWAGWQTARDMVIKQILQVAKAVAATKDPDAKLVIIQLQAIIKNLSPKPEGQAVAELQQFLNDDLVTAAEEVPSIFGSLQIRQPLLQSLQTL